jgi:hypothetical protein
MRITLLSALMLSLVFLPACGNRKKKCKGKNENPVEATNKFTTERGTTVWVLLIDMLEDKPQSDPFTLIDIHVDDLNKLHLTVEYNGGCKPHEFKILGSKAILKSLPAQRPIMITHNANGDDCRQIVREEILVDISDFAYTKESGSEIILLIDGQRLSYIYQNPGDSHK